MKRNVTLFLVLCTCLLWVSSPNTSHAAYGFFEDLEACGTTYVNTMYGGSCAGGTLHGCECSGDPNACVWDAMEGYSACLNPLITPSPEEPEFCSQAIAANQACGQTFQGVDEFGLLMECRGKSGIDNCQ